MSIEKKRVTLKPKKPNILFEKWLEEWREEAAVNGSDMQYCFAKALSSLKKYPLRLNSGKECGILQNFGTRLCVMLDRKLAEYKKNNLEYEDVMQSETASSSSISAVIDTNNLELTKNGNSRGNKKNNQKTVHPVSKIKKSPKAYLPTERSGAHALLLTLYTHLKTDMFPEGYMKKDDLQKLAQPLCDVSFVKPLSGSYYTAWSAMSTLIKKGFVTTEGRGKYSLTSEGEMLAQKLKETVKDYDKNHMSHKFDTEPPEKILHSDNIVTAVTRKETMFPIVQISPKTKKSQEELINRKVKITGKVGKVLVEKEISNICFAPGSFDILLLIDTQESVGKGSLVPMEDLKQMHVKCEVRHLKVGDFTWICRHRETGHEVVLPYIIERKRIDDFAQSIRDGRFHEQKFRLKQSGIPNIIYLVEKHGKQTITVPPEKVLNQAAINTHIIDDFIIKYTGNSTETISYLAVLTRLLISTFKDKTIIVCNKSDIPQLNISDDILHAMCFKEFNQSSSKIKQLAVKDMFIKHLIQLHGVSIEKALAITAKYPTPRLLYEEYKKGDGESLLADITFGSLKRRVGPTVSKSLNELYCKTNLS